MSYTKLPRGRMYDIIRAPIITEKTNAGSNYNQVAFYVSLSSSKKEIKSAIEGIFGVHVKSVNTLIRKGKTRRFRGKRGKENDAKRAVITLIEGDFIDVTTGV